MSIVLNDISPEVASRNLLLLQVFNGIPDPKLAADIALHLWYSAFLPQEHLERIYRCWLLPSDKPNIRRTAQGMHLDWKEEGMARIIAEFGMEATECWFSMANRREMNFDPVMEKFHDAM